MRSLRSLPLVLVLVAALVGCDRQGPLPVEPPGSGGGDAVSWSFVGLEPLGSGFVYEAWVIVGGAPVSAGRFNVLPDGTPDLAGGPLTAEQLAGAEAFVLSIEPAVGDDPAPSETKILGGAFSGGSADLRVSHPAALADDFSGAAGAFILETPTTAAVSDDHDQGIWWLDPAAGPGPSLTLPALPSGWSYEGWVVTGAGPQTTGRFRVPTGADSDGPGPTAGPDGAPPFPGQDFIAPPLPLAGTAAVITVEPEPDDSPLPFTLKPLVTARVEDVGPGVLQGMTNRSADNPTGTATLN